MAARAAKSALLVGGTLASLANTSMTQYKHVRNGDPKRALGENLFFQAGVILSNCPNPTVKAAWTACDVGNKVFCEGVSPTQALMEAAMPNIGAIAGFLDQNETVKKAVGGPILKIMTIKGFTSFAAFARASVPNDPKACDEALTQMLLLQE
jgi:hypothetical protein